MLPRAERIGTRDFRRAFENGQVVRAKLLQLRFYRRDAALKDAALKKESGTRAAFVVARKTGKATVRNRLKRRLREVYRLSRWRNDARLANTDLLIFTASAALDASNDDLEKALNDLMRRVTQNRGESANRESANSESAKSENRKTVETVAIVAEKQRISAPRPALSQGLRPARRFSARALASSTTDSSQTQLTRDADLNADSEATS